MEEGKIVVTFKSGRKKVFEVSNAQDILKQVTNQLNLKGTERAMWYTRPRYFEKENTGK